jgi:hypothetical protein
VTPVVKHESNPISLKKIYQGRNYVKGTHYQKAEGRFPAVAGEKEDQAGAIRQSENLQEEDQ